MLKHILLPFHAANLGLKSAMIVDVGNDEFGKLIISKLKKDGVETAGIK